MTIGATGDSERDEDGNPKLTCQSERAKQARNLQVAVYLQIPPFGRNDKLLDIRKFVCGFSVARHSHSLAALIQLVRGVLDGKRVRVGDVVRHIDPGKERVTIFDSRLVLRLHDG